MSAERGFYVRPLWLLLFVVAVAAGSVWKFCPTCAPPDASAAPVVARGAPIDAPIAMTPALDPEIERSLSLLAEETPLTEQELVILKETIESGVATEEERQAARDALDRILLGDEDPKAPIATLSAFLKGRAAPTDPAPLPASNPTPPATGSPVVPEDSPYTEVTFDTLAGWRYEYPTTTPKNADELKKHNGRLPGNIRALDGTKVAVKGYMIPIDVDRDAVVSFLLVRYPFGCCYGRVPEMNEWIFVKMAKGKRAEFVSHIPLPVLGTLAVGDEFEQDTVTSVYRMIADEVIAPLR